MLKYLSVVRWQHKGKTSAQIHHIATLSYAYDDAVRLRAVE
ncbi:Uncharacterised protein [Vibrio cholerae]|nr:Uncharacterised protein [Vibrio cholerae]